MRIAYRDVCFKSSMVFFISLLCLHHMIFSNEALIDQEPVAIVYNPGPKYSLINSIDHHPTQNLFCVTYTHNNKVILYTIDDTGRPEMVQELCNPLANLSQPQHAAFSPSGDNMVVANWQNQTLTVYPRSPEGLFQSGPVAVISPPSSLISHKPHGIAFSPCGKYLAIAYGAASYHGKAVALYSVTNGGIDFKLIHLLHGSQLPGIPKGITFSPDGSCLLVTFSDANSLVIYNFSTNRKKILHTPRQIVKGKECGIFRPEDVKITADGNYCAISNSAQNTVTFYPFDKITNKITQCFPYDILQNPQAGFHFPHGITFSPDGLFMLVTEFGHVKITEEGDVIWDQHTRPEESKFNVYKLFQ